MRPQEVIKLIPTGFKQVTSDPLYTGHSMPLLGTWTKADGWKKKQILEFEGLTLACPIVAIVNEKVGKFDLDLKIEAKTSKYKQTVEKEQGDYTLKRKIYEPDGTTSATLTIPRYTRPFAMFLVSSLGKNIYDISDVYPTNDVECDDAEVQFYALASEGSRIIYWLSLHRVAMALQEIINGFWIAPPYCSRCQGSGIEPDTDSDTCCQCEGYRFDGYNATKYIQRQRGFDVGLARDVLDWDNLSEEDHFIIKKFINKCWTQKWWVTPTVSEIKRFFAHFYQVDESNIQIEERFDSHEPVWRLTLPYDAGDVSPFGTLTEDDRDLLKYLAQSVTPAGVNVFVGFYEDYGSFGGDEEWQMSRPSFWGIRSTVFQEQYNEWGATRFFGFNGWTEANWHFEGDDPLDDFTTNGIIEVVNVNDMNRNMCKLEDNAYIDLDFDDILGFTALGEGTLELWAHPRDRND